MPYWTEKNLKRLYELIQKEKMSFEDAAEELGGISPSACHSKYNRTDFEKLYSEGMPKRTKSVWTSEDMRMLHAWRTGLSRSYVEIGKKLDKTPISVERKFQETDWEKFFEEDRGDKKQASQSSGVDQKEEDIKAATNALIEMARHGVPRLKSITEHDFLKKNKKSRQEMPAPFAEIKRRALEEMNRRGWCFPESRSFGPGTYLIVGDSHGKHTKRAMFRLLGTVIKDLRPKAVVHIGHIVDDDDDISCCWDDVKNLVIVAKREELEIIAAADNEYDVVRESVTIGDLLVTNQDIVSDYRETFLGTMHGEYFGDESVSTVVNMHRQELDTRTAVDANVTQIMSPGCMCEPHIVKAIKQVIWAEGGGLKQSKPDGYVKYRRMIHLKRLWEYGMIVVNVDQDGNATATQCRILKLKSGYTTSYGDKIYGESKVSKPDMKVFVNADLHCDLHDPECLDLQEQVCRSYKPDRLVGLGDSINNKPFNHHVMSRGEPILKQALDEMAHTHFVLKRMRGWAPKMDILFGNHERFAKDFVERNPQFRKMFAFDFMVGLPQLDIKLTGHKLSLTIGPLRFIHGDIKMFGARGATKLDKVFHTFGRNVMMGDVHYPSTRRGCHSIGFSAVADHEYNEPHASRWTQGFACCNIFEGAPFIQNMTIKRGRCCFGGRFYRPKSPAKWGLPNGYKAAISFS